MSELLILVQYAQEWLAPSVIHLPNYKGYRPSEYHINEPKMYVPISCQVGRSNQYNWHLTFHPLNKWYMLNLIMCKLICSWLKHGFLIGFTVSCVHVLMVQWDNKLIDWNYVVCVLFGYTEITNTSLSCYAQTDCVKKCHTLYHVV